MGGTPITPVNANTAAVRDGIARAAARTGTNFDFLLAQARIESSLNPMAKAGSSSAAGLFQFTNATWLKTLERHGAKHGYGWASAAVKGGKIINQSMASQIMALRFNPDASSLVAGELAGDNRDNLVGSLGREPDDTELYLAHFLGSGDAARFIKALEANPSASAAALFPSAAASNPSIFLDASGNAQSLGDVWNLMSSKVSAAKANGSFDPNSFDTAFLLAGQGYHAPPRRAAPVAQPLPETSANQSMSDSLKSMFGSPHASSTPPAIKAAYTKLERFGL